MARFLSAILTAVLLTACSSGSEDASTTPTPSATVIDSQLKALQDAKQIQAAQEEADKKRRQALDEAGG